MSNKYSVRVRVYRGWRIRLDLSSVKERGIERSGIEVRVWRVKWEVRDRGIR